MTEGVVMRSEPCKNCGNLRPMLAIEQGDDFCSTECARRYYGTATGERRSPGRERSPAPAAIPAAAKSWRKRR